MTQLSSQSISRLCSVLDRWGRPQQPMIWPFVGEKTVRRGKSYGLSSASYDLRIAHDLRLPAHPMWRLARRLQHGFMLDEQAVLRHWLGELRADHSHGQLAHTLEWVTIPDNVVGYVVDKSTYARQFVSAMNTLFDPGFQGHGVLELVNLGATDIYLYEGDPICQMAFHWLDKKTDRPYRGKYFGQIGIVGPRHEQ